MALPAEGLQLKAGVIRPCPYPYSPEPQAIFCLLLFPLEAGQVMGFLLLPSPALWGLKPKVLVGRRMWQIRSEGKEKERDRD